MRVQTHQDLATWRDAVIARQAKARKHIIVCGGPGCLAAGSAKLFAALKDRLRERKLDVDTTLRSTLSGCHGLCERGPLVIVEPGHLFYPKVKPAMLDAILDASVVGDGFDDKLAYRPTEALKQPKAGKKTKLGAPLQSFDQIPFYKHQQRLALRHCGAIDPESIEDYIAHGGYRALVHALTTMSPADVVAAVDASGLRGRGGAGFATGKKWRSCIGAAEKREQAGERDVPRHILCNGDEGDPGAFMDRVIMEGDPHSVIEGMIIGAYALGSRHGWIYVREEYPLAVERLGKAIADARAHGFLGDEILGTEFCFDLSLSRGGGAFVCGESSALMQSVAGHVGEPRAKYVRSVERGLFDQPTVLNNVETFNCVPWILEHGAAAFAAIGPTKSPGTKAFSLSGTVRHTGLIEVPMGVTLRHIIYNVGGGILNERPFKAVQTGGPSGGCLPESCLDLQVDFDSLTKVGAMMGSGGMIVMDDYTCMVDVARYFTRFLTEESCGKCVPCREGLTQLHTLLDRICKGQGRMQDLALIDNLAFVLEASLCALGTSAMNPVMSTLKYFRDEYVEHIEHGRCRAGVCTALSRFEVLDSCTGCLVCKRLCPVQAIAGEKQEKHVIDQDTCTHCGVCMRACKFDAIKVM